MVAAVVTTDIITLYKDNAETIVVPQGHPNVPYIIGTLIPEIKANKWAYYEPIEVPQTNLYTEYESKSKLVRFFSVAKQKVAQLFGSDTRHSNETLTPDVAGSIPVSGDSGEPSKSKLSDEQVLAEVMAHATPSDSVEFTDASQEKTVIAIVGGKVIPDAQNINRHLAYANKTNTVAMDNFFKRLSAVIDNRLHSVEDLMHFLKSADLPIADDGRVIVYKNLNNRGDKRLLNGEFVDIHSNRIVQSVGCRVELPISLVDPNRRQDCSNGLHIANPSYLSGFRGDVTVMCKVDPADFIAVPEYNTNKARVCGYDILALLTDKQANLVMDCKPITNDPDGKKLLEKAMRGDLDQMHTLVTVNGHKGTDVVRTSINAPLKKAEPEKKGETVNAAPLEEVESIVTNPTPKVDPQSIDETPVKKTETKAKSKKATTKAKASPNSKTTESPRTKILAVLADTTPEKLSDTEKEYLYSLRKQAKKSFKALGVPEEFLAVL